MARARYPRGADRLFPANVMEDIFQNIASLKSGGHTYLFTMRDWKSMSKSSYDKMWQRILKEIEKVTGESSSGLTTHVFLHNYFLIYKKFAKK